MRPLSVLLISDDRPGHYHLSEGVIAAIARVRPVATRTVRVCRRRWLPGRLLQQAFLRGVPPRRILASGFGLYPDGLGQPDLIVSAGGETMIVNAAAARLTGAASIFCGTLRRLPPEAFSLVVSSYSRHAGLPRHLVTLKPNGIDPDSLGRSSSPRRLGPDAPPQIAGLLIGGDSGYFRYAPHDWQQLTDFLRQSHAACGTRWLLSTSRRSPGALADQLGAIAAEHQSPIAELIDFRSSGPGTLPRVFKEAEAIVCTEDSSTMVSEAVCARIPVVGVSPSHHGFKEDEAEYRRFMRERGWCRFVPLADLSPDRFLAELAAITPLAENHLDRLAASLRERLPGLFA